MNILAHLILSGDSDDVRFGNFIADTVKGRQYLNWEGGVREGILLHRFIDTYTDEHPSALVVRRMLAEDIGLYAPVALDILFDHLLSLHWDEFYSQDRKTFIRECYALIEDRFEALPNGMKAFSRAMIDGDWLRLYKTESGILSALKGLSSRIKTRPPLHLAMEHWNNSPEEILSHFRMFYSDLKVKSEQKLIEIQKQP